MDDFGRKRINRTWTTLAGAIAAGAGTPCSGMCLPPDELAQSVHHSALTSTQSNKPPGRDA